uniref:Septin-type G domain-containing protein n=1 Tax=Meloidogyne hapla TaxID=6305 RepID=A0A1I8AY81_MELHA
MSTINKTGISSRNIDYIGFANFPNQVFRRCIRTGFEFSLMVVGQSGLGKSTFLNTLFMAELHDLKQDKFLELKSTVNIESKTFRLIENDVRLKVTVVDTPGFGDFVDNSRCWEPIVKYIDDRFADYLAEETKIDRSPIIEDKRVHLCIYFIPPTGHGLKQLDKAFMQALQDRVNIIPVIAKADTLTPNELGRFKQKIIEDMRKNNISLYKFHELDEKSQPHQNANDGSNSAQLELSKRPPFAIVGSTNVKEILVGGERDTNNKQRVRVREYPWGTVEVDNLAHNDFVALRDMIVRNNLIDLIEITNCLHYENYRMRNSPQSSFNDFKQLEREFVARQIEEEDARRKREALFNEDVVIREQRLEEKELALADATTIVIEENNILSSRKNALPPDLPTSTAKPAKIPRLNSFIAPLPVVNNSNSIYPCKGILQTFEISPSFFTTKPSSKLGLVLHKAEVEGREYQQRVTPKLQQ